MTTCKNRAWQAAQSALIWEQGVAGSNPAVPTRGGAGQGLSPVGLRGRDDFERWFRATSVPLREVASGYVLIVIYGLLPKKWTLTTDLTDGLLV